MSPQTVLSVMSRTAMAMACPTTPDPAYAGDPASAPKCSGGGRNTSFYGAGLIDAAAAAAYK
jgi:hypothetical protein